MAMKAISLFSGAGGMDIGFKKAGAVVVWANELDNDASATYMKNNPDTILRQGDIRIVKRELLHFGEGAIDLVFGGPPCQGFSVAGKMDPNDGRSELVWEYFDVVKMLKPKVFVMENVKALGELPRWRSIRDRISETAYGMGYSCFFKVLNSADFGVPQKRERVFFIGFLNECFDVLSHFEKAIRKQRKPRTSLRDCLLKIPPAGTDKNPLSCTAKIALARSPVLRKSPYAGMLFNGLGRPLDLDNQANTLPASMGGNKTPILDELLLRNPDAEDWVAEYHKELLCGNVKKPQPSVPPHLRRITAVEAAAIQTFPRNYEFVGEKSSVYRQIGNAVPCDLAAVVAEAVKEVFLKEHPQISIYKKSEDAFQSTIAPTISDACFL
jgi:DNA (cytosine-5)-methyltransferase 1